LGAFAALLGLLFVGVSINLTKILGSRDLADRSLLAMILLLTILIVSSLLLIPGQPLIWLGAEILILSAGVWIAGMIIEVRTLQRSDQSRTILASNLILLQAATIPLLIAGGALVLADANGLY
jgi:modulator of FtsH protease